MIRTLSVGLFAASLSACFSENDKSDVTFDSGIRKDTGGSKDGTNDGTEPSDTSVAPLDTGTTTGDSKPPTDGGMVCNAHTGDECNMVKQDCADMAATCQYDSTKSYNVCIKSATGTKLKGEACTKPADCDRGLFCYSNKCSPACCSGDSSVCGPGGTCNLAITDMGGAVIYQACSYSAKCNAFKYDCPTGQVCLFNEDPDVFKCSTPGPGASGIGTAPGGKCMYSNDCGESQACFALTSGGDAAADYKCYLFCWLDKPDTFTPGTTPGGRFPANGTCTVGGASYGTCTSLMGIGGGLGVCVK